MKILIYILLITIGFFGTIIDWFLWANGQPAYTLNTFVQAVAILIATLWWQSADAEDRGINASSLSKVATIVFLPIGTAIYFYQSREWKVATAMLVAFWGGLVLALIAGDHAGNWLATNGVFNAS